MTDETIEPSTAGEEFHLDDEECETIIRCIENGQPGRVTPFEIKELVRFYRSRLPLASSVEATGGAEWVAVRRATLEEWARMIEVDGTPAQAGPTADDIHALIVEPSAPDVLSAAPPSPRSDDGSGLTPSNHGFSAALRAQAIEECAKVADAVAFNEMEIVKDNDGPQEDTYGNEIRAAAATNIAAAIRSISAVSAIAQERDVGKGCSPLPWEVDTIDNQTDDGTIKSYAIFDANGRVIMDALNSSVIEINTEHDGEPEGFVRQWDEQSRKDAELIVAAVNAFMDRSPK